MAIKITRNPVGQYALTGITQKVGRQLETIGWTWARGVGCPGAWMTKSAEVAEAAALRLGIEIIEYTTWR